jgi:hypothetical protein
MTINCPVCGGAVSLRPGEAIPEHQRYADGAGLARNQPHDLVRCEASDSLAGAYTRARASGHNGDRPWDCYDSNPGWYFGSAILAGVLFAAVLIVVSWWWLS